MVHDRIWAPWRLAYVKGEKPAGCVFCDKPAQGDDEDALIVARGEHSYVVLNLFPYNPGHLMVIPYRHVAGLDQLTHDETVEAQVLLRDAVTALRTSVNPGGFNVGLNMGSAAGAGIAEHLHWHLVPRWDGDTNFMPVLAETKVMAQHLETTWELVRAGFGALGYEIEQKGAAQDA